MRETDFKQTEIGLIPLDWNIKELHEISSTSSGGTPSRRNSSYYQGSIRWFTTSELNDCTLYDSKDHITEEAIMNSSAKIFPKGTLLMAMYGATIGKLGVLSNESATNQACCAIFCEEIDVMYLFYYLLQNRNRIIELGIGAAQPNISQSIINHLVIGLPTLQEQKKIGNLLSQVEKLISILKNLIEKKDAIKAGAMSQLLSGKLRLPGFSEPWISTSLDELGVLLSNNTLSRDNLTESGTIGNIHYGDILTKFGAILDLDNTAIPFIHLQMSSKFLKSHLAKEGDIIFADTAEDETVGKATELVNVKDRAIVSGLHTFWFRPLTKFASKYLGYAVNSHEFHQQVIPVISGTKVCSISKPNLLSFTLTYPSDLEEQKAIAKVLTDMDDEISALEAKLKKYEQLKKGMMQQLLTGKIRLVSPNESLS